MQNQIEEIKKEYQKINAELAKPEVFSDVQKSQKLMKRQKNRRK